MTTSMSLRCRPLSPAVALAATLLAASTATWAGTPINKQVTVDPSGAVEVSNTSGTVTVTGWDKNVVDLTGELGDGVDHLEFTTTDNVTKIRVVLPDHAFHVGDTRLVVRMPVASRLSVNTVSADIGVQSVGGAQRLQSVSGNIHTEAGTEDVECKTVSGDVVIDGTSKVGLVTVNTVSGDARIMKVAGEVNANTVSGDLILGLGETARSRLRSTSGDITLASTLAADGKVDIESISGDVQLILLEPVSAEFDVSTFSGDISDSFGQKPVATSEYAPGKELHFREGQGTGRVRIKTLSGDISIRKK